ncbi:hypothetical protein CRUP_033602 [Coryphaenoides rupestris]|nr:hypothetical protein CRUP_033602 [Coryphaenoides rupestris]
MENSGLLLLTEHYRVILATCHWNVGPWSLGQRTVSSQRPLVLSGLLSKPQAGDWLSCWGTRGIRRNCLRSEV